MPACCAACCKAPPWSTFCSWLVDTGRFCPVLIQGLMMLPSPPCWNMLCRPARPPICGLLIILIIAPRAEACCPCCAPLLPAMASTSSISPIDSPFVSSLRLKGERDRAEDGRSLLYSLLLLLRDDHVLDLVVGGLGNDLLLDQVGLLCIRAAVND